MAAKIRWGILGCGSIVNKFAEAPGFVDDAQIVAVGSHSDEKAKEFGDKYKAIRHYGSYQELAGDKGINTERDKR
jgi:predicted dehydrogenase